MSSDDRFSADDHYSARPPKKSSGKGWAYGIIGCVAAGVIAPVLLICGLCGGLVHWAMNEEATLIAAAVENEPTLQAEIGEISSCTINWGTSIAVEDEDVMVYDISGDKGSGQLFVHESDDVPESIVLHKGDQEWNLDFNPAGLIESSLEPDVMDAISRDETIQSEIGKVTSCNMNLKASLQEEKDALFIYDIEGDKGSGQIALEFDDDEKVLWAKLKKDGQSFDLKVRPLPSGQDANVDEPNSE